MTHLIVALHHAFGAYIACTIGKKIYIQYATYSVAFTLIWSFSAIISWKLITNVMDIGIDDDDEDDLELGYMYGFNESPPDFRSNRDWG